MKMKWMTSAALTLGISAAPVMAGEFPGPDPAAVDGRAVAVQVDRDWHRRIPIAEVPPQVIATARHFGTGRHIDSVELVRGYRGDAFVVQMSGKHHKHHMSLRIDPAGGLISINR